MGTRMGLLIIKKNRKSRASVPLSYYEINKIVILPTGRHIVTDRLHVGVGGGGVVEPVLPEMVVFQDYTLCMYGTNRFFV